MQIPRASSLHQLVILTLVLMVMYAGIRMRVAKVIIAMSMLHLFLSHVRFAYLFYFIVPLACSFEIAMRSPALASPALGVATRDSIADFVAAHARKIIAAFLTFYLAAGIGVFTFSGAMPSTAIAPVQALAFARSAGLSGNVLNSGKFGGFLISEGVKTFVDGRSDQLFGNSFLQDILETSRADGSKKLDRMLEKYNVQWVLLQVSDSRVPLFDGNAGWKRLYRDKTAIIYVRSF